MLSQSTHHAAARRREPPALPADISRLPAPRRCGVEADRYVEKVREEPRPRGRAGRVCRLQGLTHHAREGSGRSLVASAQHPVGEDSHREVQAGGPFLANGKGPSARRPGAVGPADRGRRGRRGSRTPGRRQARRTRIIQRAPAHPRGSGESGSRPREGVVGLGEKTWAGRRRCCARPRRRFASRCSSRALPSRSRAPSRRGFSAATATGRNASAAAPSPTRQDLCTDPIPIPVAPRFRPESTTARSTSPRRLPRALLPWPSPYSIRPAVSSPATTSAAFGTCCARARGSISAAPRADRLFRPAGLAAGAGGALRAGIPAQAHGRDLPDPGLDRDGATWVTASCSRAET